MLGTTQKKYGAIVIGGSAGSFQPVAKILTEISANFNIPIILCLHRLKHVRHGFVEALTTKSSKKIVEPDDKDKIKPGLVYLAPSNYHLIVETNRSFALSTEEMLNNSRPAIDIAFSSAAQTYRSRLIGVLLSGANRDGAQGMVDVKRYGGVTLAQDPDECAINVMPKSAIKLGVVDHVKTVNEIIDFLKSIM